LDSFRINLIKCGKIDYCLSEVYMKSNTFLSLAVNNLFQINKKLLDLILHKNIIAKCIAGR
jgi:hypothetical protein